MSRFFRTSLAILGMSGSAVSGGAHTWDVNEVFSNADGTIQFVELREANGTSGEIFLAGLMVSSVMTGNSFTIPSNLTPPSTNRHLLFATAAFAALPGAPTPDYIFPAGSVPFFAIFGDTVQYAFYDSFTFGPVPTDGVMSMNDGGVIAANSPTNYAGQTGSVDASPDVAGDSDGDGDVDLGDYAAFAACLNGPTCEVFDFDSDDDNDLQDFSAFQNGFTG